MIHKSFLCIFMLILVTCFIIGCGEDDDPTVITTNYLPIEVGNSWTFIEPDYSEDVGIISITGKTKLANGKTVFIATASEGFGGDGEGYLSRAANDLLLFHSVLTDLQGELIYNPPIRIGATWQGQEGNAEVVTQETVNTPAGIFPECFRINVHIDEFSENEYYAVWLAKNVGPVKLSMIDTSEGNVEDSFVLKDYSTGRSVEEDQGLSGF